MAPKRSRSSRSSSSSEPLTPALHDDPATPATATLGPAPSSLPPLPLLPPSAKEGAQGKDDLSALECPVCYSYMQPPFVQCANAHPVCNDCRTTGQLTQCPICRVSIEEDDSLAPNNALMALAAHARVPCSNDCGATVDFLKLREHQTLECPNAPRTCPVRAGFCFDSKGWSTVGQCECRGLDVTDPKGLAAHLTGVHGLGSQERDKDRSSTWTLTLPAATLFEAGGPFCLDDADNSTWGQPAQHKWEPTILSGREDGKTFLAQCVAARHAGLSLLVLGLGPGCEGMYLTAEMQARCAAASRPDLAPTSPPSSAPPSPSPHAPPGGGGGRGAPVRMAEPRAGGRRSAGGQEQARRGEAAPPLRRLPRGGA